MRVIHRLGLFFILVVGASVPLSRLRAQSKKVKPFLGTCGTIQNPCEPNIDFMGNTFSAATVPVETGPYRFTITVLNSGNADGDFGASCGTAPQISCTASPSSFHLVQGAQIVDTIIWSAASLGSLPMLVRYTADPSTGEGHPVSLTFTGNSITITGAPIATVTFPPNDGVLIPGDTIRGVFSHPSGVDSTTYKIFVDGHDSTGSAHTHRVGSTLWANLTLLGGSHTIKTWGCAKNSPVRCDTSVVVVAAEAAPPTQWQLDDSLAPNSDARFGWVPGGLPLPATNLLGCPVTLGDPTINVTDPASYLGQLNGNVFVAPIIWDDSIHINAVTHAQLPNDTANVCSHQTTFPFLQDSLFDWTFWPHSDPHDTLWYYYPYHDRTPAAIAQTIGAPPQGGFANTMAVVPGRGAAPGTQPPGSGLLLLPQSGSLSMPVVRPFLQNGGGIDTNSYNVTLNGDTIIKHGKPVAGKGVVEQGLATATSLYSMSTAHTNVNIYDPIRPDTSHNGGWNELIASIADTLGRRTSIRSRFVVVKSPTPIASLRPQALRSFSHLDQSDCAAFGAFQCGGTILSQTIPGFVTRDRDRSLHLVYRSASQKIPVILPFGVTISRLQLAPDSFLVSAHEGAVRLPDSLRYIGAGIPNGVSHAESLTALNQEATAYRVLGSDIPAAATTHAIRSITTVFHPLYAGTAVEDSVTQEVVQLYLTDTTTGRFGPGWTLGEVSRLVLGDMSQGLPAAIWLDGDGSYHIFRKVSGVWTAPPGLSVRLDTTTQTSSDSAKYTLALATGAMVGFRSDGWQVWTQDLVGNRTIFTYAAGTTRLVKITDPTGARDSILYNAANASGQVSDILMIGRNGGADTARVASFAYDGTTKRLIKSTIWRSASGTDAVRGDTTRFGYVTATAYGALLDTIVDPRSTASIPIVTTLQYDSLYALPIVEKRPPDRYGVDSISIRFPWRRAVPRVGYGRRNANGTLQLAERLVSVNQYVGTHIDYDNNATDFTMGWFGSPTYVRNFAPPPVTGGGFLIIGNGGDNVRRITHDSLGRVTKIVQSPDSTSITDSVMYHYDALNRVDQIYRRTAAFPATAGALDTVSFKYDSVTLSGGAWCSRMDTTVDVMKKKTYVVYGSTGASRCLPVKVIGLARDTTSFTYGSLLKGDSAGVRPISTTDPTHVTQTMQYDHSTWNSAISTRVVDTAVSRAFYNPWGRPDSTVAPDGVRTFYRYDLSGRVRDTKTGVGSSVPTTRTFFNHGGLPDSVKVYASGDNFAAGNDTTPLASPTPQNTRYYYDRLGFVDSSFTPGGRHLHYLRDRLGNPIWEYPGNGTYIVRIYDWMGRVTAETQSQVDPSYSADGLAFADATTKSVYQAQRFQVGLTLSTQVSHSFSYSNRGWLGTMLDSVSNRSISYNPAGSITSDQVHFTDGATIRRTYQYNQRGQRTLAVTAVSGVTVAEPADTTSYFYSDSTGRLDSLRMTSSNGYKVARAVWSYDRAGRDSVQRLAIASNAGYLSWEDSTLSQYDAAGRLSRWQNRTSGFTNAWYDFRSPTYDHADLLKSYGGTEPVAGGLNPSYFDASVSYTMSYATDGSRRLLQSVKAGGSPITHSYRYDTFGNRLSEGPGCTQLYTYGSDNRILTRADSVLCSNRRATFWTDAVGNRLEEVDSTGTVQSSPQLMSYTAKNQLFFSQSASVITGIYDFNWHYYDGKGLREESVVSNGQAYLPGSYASPDSGQHSYYFYDGSNVALVLVKSGNTWWVRQRYLMGGVDGPLALRVATSPTSGSQNLVIVTDRSGSTISAIDTTKQQLQKMWAISRDPYGKTDQAGPQSGNQINLETGFAGASSPNSGAGFVYLRNRWYDPTTGRFLTQDPIGLAGGVNLYAYAGNNPIYYDDPFGDTLHIVGARLQAAVAALRSKDTRVDAVFKQLEDSPINFTIVDASEVDVGFASPDSNRWEAGHSYDREDKGSPTQPDEKLLAVSGNSRGISAVDDGTAAKKFHTTPALVAFHEAIHLTGIATVGRNSMYTHKPEDCAAFQVDAYVNIKLGYPMAPNVQACGF